MTISVSARKSKGRRLQQWCCERIARIVGIEWGPDEEIASREMGQAGTDVRLSPRVRKLFPFSVECKWQESWSVPEFIRQARANRMPDTDWLLILRRSREREIAVIDAELFFWLIDNISADALCQRISDEYNGVKGGEADGR